MQPEQNFLIPEKWVENPWIAYGIMALFIVAAAILRLLNLSENTIWLDEAYTLFYAQTSFSELLATLSGDPNPPLHNLFMKVWIEIFGIGKTICRVPSLLFSLVSMGVMFQLGKRFFNLETAIIACLFFLLSTPHLFFAQTIRSYALSTLLCLLSFYAFLALFERGKWIVALACTLLSVALMMTHYSNFLLFFGQAGASFFYFKQQRKAFWMFWGSQGLAVLLFLPWVIYFVQNGLQTGATHFNQGHWGDLIRVPGQLIGNKTLWVVFLLFVTGSLVFFFAKLQKQFKPEEKAKLFLLFGWGVVGLFVGWLVSARTNFFEPKYLLPVGLGLFFLLGYLTSLIPLPRWVHGVWIIALGITAAWEINLNPQHQEGWPQVMEVVKAAETENSRTFLAPHYNALPFVYYYDRAIFEGGDHDQLYADLNEKGIHCISTGEAYREGFQQPFKEQGINRVIMIQSGYKKFDPHGNFERVVAQDFTPVQLEFCANTRIVVFDR